MTQHLFNEQAEDDYEQLRVNEDYARRFEVCVAKKVIIILIVCFCSHETKTGLTIAAAQQAA